MFRNLQLRPPATETGAEPRRRLYVKWKDAMGVRRMRISTAKTVAEANRLTEDLERKAER